MLETGAALVIAAALNLYVLTGGADYGGGVWDLAATGSRARRQRELVAEAIGPIWEANHVWLILVVVVLFTGFPRAFALISTQLHIPVTALLIGIVLRGSSFVFRAYGGGQDRTRRLWGMVFAISSLVTPIWLGVIVGALSSGKMAATLSASQVVDFVSAWTGAFPFAVGLFALSLFAFLAAVYLTVESTGELREDFRRRALVAGAAVAACALLVFVLAKEGAPDIRQRLMGSWWSWPLQIATAVSALGAWYGIWTRQFQLARVSAAAQVSLIFWGWALAQQPFLILPSMTLSDAAAPPETLRLMLIVIAAGGVVLLPSFYYLFRVFKSPTEPPEP